jgi:hypothetical protein
MMKNNNEWNEWRQRGEMKKTLLGCTAIIIAGILLNSDYNNVLLKILGTILIIVITKLFEGEC